MTADQSLAATPVRAPTQWRDITAIAVCTLIWGTTWYAITLQFGVVDPVISVVYRFTLAALILICWCLVRGETIALTRAQHVAAFGLGLSTFAINYTFVYWAEQRVASAVVAVLFAAMAFINLAVFKVIFGQRAARLAWAAAALGVVGVGVLSWSEVVQAHLGGSALIGIALALAAVVSGVFGNVFARRGELAGAPVAASTAWAMAYGAGLLAVFAAVTGRHWAFTPTLPYLLSLLHLSLNGSVIAFLLYYGLARRRGYATASYISALAPPVAMLMSILFEAKTWGAIALLGVALVLSGQVLLLRVRRA